MGAPKICATCKHAFTLPDQPKHRRCMKSDASGHDDASLCGEMRKQACLDGAQWEAIDG